jgi:hypothetical protein
MIINEKGLIKIMKEAHKGYGYSVAVTNDAIGVESIIIITKECVIVGDKKKMPWKVLGLIVEHMGELPVSGEAYQVRKNQPQTEIFDAATATLKNIHADNKPLKVVKRTDLTLGGYRLWQRKEDLKIFKIDPVLEDVLEISRGIHRIVGDDLLMMEDRESRAYVYFEKPDKNGSAWLDHLSQMQWVAM